MIIFGNSLMVANFTEYILNLFRFVEFNLTNYDAAILGKTNKRIIDIIAQKT